MTFKGYSFERQHMRHVRSRGVECGIALFHGITRLSVGVSELCYFFFLSVIVAYISLVPTIETCSICHICYATCCMYVKHAKKSFINTTWMFCPNSRCFVEYFSVIWETLHVIATLFCNCNNVCVLLMKKIYVKYVWIVF